MKLGLSWERCDDAMYLHQHVGDFEMGEVSGKISVCLPMMTSVLIDVEEPERRRYRLDTTPAIQALVESIGGE